MSFVINPTQTVTLKHGQLVRLGKEGLLTPQQWEVWSAINERGYSVKEVAEALGRNPRTIRRLLRVANTKQRYTQRNESRLAYFGDDPWEHRFAGRIDQIYGGLYQSGIPRSQDVYHLGIDVIVNVSTFDNMLSHPCQVKVDLHDADLPNLTLIGALGLYVARQLHAGKKVLVHCQMGMNRSSLITGLALWFLTGWDGRQISRLIRRQRQHTLANQKFAEYIELLPEWDSKPMLTATSTDELLMTVADMMPPKPAFRWLPRGSTQTTTGGWGWDD